MPKLKKSASAQAKSAPKAPRQARKRGAEKDVSFRMALLEPFDPRADGARVPDLFSAPTEARTFRQSFTLTSDGGGNLDYIAFANPAYCGFSTRSNVTGGGTFTLSSNSSVTVANSVPTGVGSSLSGEFTSYRVVGFGLRITSIASITESQGVVVATAIPYAGYVPHYGTVGGQAHTAGNVGTLADWLAVSGIPVGGSSPDIAKLDSVGQAERRSAQSLAEKPLELVSRPIDPRAYQFRYASDVYYGYDMVGQTSTTYVVAGNGAYLDASGWLTFVIGGTGFGLNKNVLSVDMVYHLEGLPAVSGSILNRGSATVSPMNWSYYIDSLIAAAKRPAVRSMIATAAASLNPALAALVPS